MNKIILTGSDLTTENFSEVSKSFDTKIELSKESITRIKKCREGLENTLRGDRVIYGINTGFGSLANIKIDNDKLAALQRNLIRSHTAGTGELLSREVVRGSMILRLNTLALGHSGVRIEIANLLVDMLNNGIYPQIPRNGSVGASGDLALLSAMALAMTEPDVSKYQPMVDIQDSSGNWVEMKSAEALKSKGLKPVTLQAKEGIALNNGCQVSNSIASIAMDMIFKGFTATILASTISIQAILGNTTPFDSRVHRVRPHAGQSKIAEVMLSLLGGSKLVDTEFSKVQDAYSMRCMPQVAGSAFDILKMSKNTLEIEMNSATDNPLLFENGDTLDSISGGNFHGAPIAHACDIAIIAVTDLASIAERRTFRLITGVHSGLPSFLTENPGLSSGLMIAQYTSANLVTLCKSLCFPSSVDTIPTCEGQEDHVSMAPVSAWRLLEVAKAFVSVCAIELLVSCQAVEMRMKKLGIKNNDGLSKITKKAFDIVRAKVSFISNDEPISPHIKKLENTILSGNLNIIDSLV